MRIAIPIWEDKVSPVFDTASRLLIVEIENRKEASRFVTYLDQQDLPQKCSRIRGMEVDFLICGAISRSFSSMLKASGINIIPWISGHTEDVLEAYLQGTLSHPNFLMPGCKMNRLRQRDTPLDLKKSYKQKRKRHGRGERN